MRLITFRNQGQVEIGALIDADTRVVRLHACDQLRGGQLQTHLTDMLAFLRGGSAARDSAEAALDFALSQRPEAVMLDRASVELLSPVPRPESIRDFMAFRAAHHQLSANHGDASVAWALRRVG